MALDLLRQSLDSLGRRSGLTLRGGQQPNARPGCLLADDVGRVLRGLWLTAIASGWLPGTPAAIQWECLGGQNCQAIVLAGQAPCDGRPTVRLQSADDPAP